MIEVCEVYKGGTKKPELLYTYEVEVPDPKPDELEALRAEIAGLKQRVLGLEATNEVVG